MPDAAWDLGSLSKGKRAFAQITTPQALISTIVDLAGLSVTFLAEPGRHYRISGFTTVGTSGASAAFRLVVADGANSVLRYRRRATMSLNETEGIDVAAYDSPVPGLVTYKLRLERTAGSGTLTAQSGNDPGSILVEDIGLA